MVPPPRLSLHFADQGASARRHAAEQALTATDPGDHVERARLLAVAAAASVSADPAAAQHAALLAEQEADATADESARAWSLVAASVADLSSARTLARAEMTKEALDICARTGIDEAVPTAYFLHLAALAELGEISRLDRALSPTGTLFVAYPKLAEGRHAAWFRCLRATLDGHVEVAEQLAQTAFGVASASGDPDAQSVLIGQLAIIRWMQGRVVELEPAFLHARQSAPHEPIWGVSLAWMWLRQGRRSAARGLVASLPAADQLPVDRNWLATACILADVAVDLGERDIAASVYQSLLPYADRVVTIGLGITCWGTVARTLAQISRCVGDDDAAVAHYRHAISQAASIGAHPWLAEAQWELASMLAARAGPGDHDEALELASEAAATGRALKLIGIEGAAAQVLAQLRPADSAAPEPAARQPGRPQIRVLGGFEVLSASGDPVRWKSRKARQLLRALVARRGAAVSRESLMHALWPDEAPQRVSNRFSVAVSTVRRALDPESGFAADAFLDSSGGIRLRIDRIDIDVEDFLSRAEAALASDANADMRMRELRGALAAYGGEPLADDGEELWLDELRREANAAYFGAAHALAELAEAVGDHLLRVEVCTGILNLDVYDQRAHDGLEDALRQLGAHGRANAAAGQRRMRMSELGLS